MFVDKADVIIRAGNGGNGRVSFRHEKFIRLGGPDGGDGGNGGNVILVASRNQNTLANFRYQKELAAEPGKPGDKRKKHGRSGEDLRVAVPVGTAVIDKDGKLLADLFEDGQEAVIAKGGKGGFGNAHFVSSTRQAPRLAEKGERGESLEVVFELKMIADVGLIGLPNAGKSTLLASLSNARPEIADYPFTTLTPNLGMVDVDRKNSLLFADIPGLIEGASKGKGLGDEFLRHVERTAVLLHLIDIYNDDVTKSYETIQEELKAYKIDLSKRPQIVALNKIEGLDTDIIKDKLDELREVVPKSVDLFAISGKSKEGAKELLFVIKDVVAKAHKKAESKKKPEIPVLRLGDDRSWKIEKVEDGFRITGKQIERFATRTDFDDYYALQRLRDIMKKTGITRELIRKGVKPGDKLYIGDNHLEY